MSVSAQASSKDGAHTTNFSQHRHYQSMEPQRGGYLECWVESVKQIQCTRARAWGRTSFCLQKTKEFLAPKGLGWMALGLGRATLWDKFDVKNTNSTKKTRYSANETYNFKEPTKRSHPISLSCFTSSF